MENVVYDKFVDELIDIVNYITEDNRKAYEAVFDDIVAKLKNDLREYTKTHYYKYKKEFSVTVPFRDVGGKMEKWLIRNGFSFMNMDMVNTPDCTYTFTWH